MLFFFCRCLLIYVIFFFFSSRRRHTISYGDWSSDVCSSDLDRPRARRGRDHRRSGHVPRSLGGGAGSPVPGGGAARAGGRSRAACRPRPGTSAWTGAAGRGDEVGRRGSRGARRGGRGGGGGR